MSADTNLRAVSVAVVLIFFSVGARVIAGNEAGTSETRIGAVPIGPEQLPEDAKLELAKAGARQFVDEILLEATNPTNSAAYKERAASPSFSHSKAERLSVQANAFKKLAYIKDRSTVKVVAAFLYAKETPSDHSVAGDVIFDLPSELAMQTLARIVDNPPQIDLPAASETHDARLKIWQQWWEQNKRKYP